MTRDELSRFLRQHKLAVQASVGPSGAPQAAVIGYGVSDELELVFDTLESTRKFQNLQQEPRIALVIGWDQQTLQLDGVASFPTGEALERARQCYFVAYPDGRDRLAWPGITHVMVRPTWLRFSDFSRDPPHIVEGGMEAFA